MGKRKRHKQKKIFPSALINPVGKIPEEWHKLAIVPLKIQYLHYYEQNDSMCRANCSKGKKAAARFQ